MSEDLSICRICLNECEHGVSMFELNNNGRFCDRIKNFFGLEMVQHSNLPSEMCESCCSELSVAMNFVTKCRLSIEKLQDLLPKQRLLNTYVCEIKMENVDDLPLPSFPSVKVKTENEEFPDDKNGDSFPVGTSEHEEIETQQELQTASPKYKLKCETCGLLTINQAALIAHRLVHTGERPFACAHCDRAFSQKGTLREHIDRKHKIKPNTQLVKKDAICDICGKNSFRKRDLQIHMRVHTKEKPYTCKTCSLSFSQIGTLIKHTKIHTGERPFRCHTCGKGFTASNNLKKHMIVHTSEKNYTCSVCSRPFKSRETLKAHMLLHTSEKLFPCDQCEMVFSQKGSLKRHATSRHSSQGGKCETCKKIYSNIMEHNNTHTGEKPFACQLCEKRFSHHRFLITHLRRHQEAKKFACTYEGCDAGFPLQTQLDFHIIKTHHENFPFACSVCFKGYYRASDLNKHMNKRKCRRIKKNVKSSSLELEKCNSILS